MAARMAGVDSLRYHSFDQRAKEKVEQAQKVLRTKIFKKDKKTKTQTKKLSYKQFIARILAMKYSWGTPNGT